MRVVMTGGTGFLGHPVAKKLREEGCRVTAITRPKTGAELEALGCDLIGLDLAASDSVPALAGHDLAIFLAQSRSYRDRVHGSRDVIAVNLLGLTRFLELARQARVKRFLYFSSGSVYEPSFDPLPEDFPTGGRDLYAMSKRMGEEIASRFRDYFDVLILRPFVLYGPGQRDRMIPLLLAQVAQAEPVRLEPRDDSDTNPEGLVVTPCHVDDAARIVTKLLETSADGVLNLAGCERVSIRTIAQEAGRLLGIAPRIEVEESARRGDLIADVSRLLALMQPKFIPFREGLEQTVRQGGHLLSS
jgi:nucleoside-diphosphate-sugar epimerase